MIFDQIKNIASYHMLNENFRKAIDFLLKNDIYSLPIGKIEIDSKEVFGFVKETDLEAENLRWEAHKEYADIQIILGGGERIAYTPFSSQSISEPYDADKDVLFYSEADKGIEFTLGKGDFIALMPGELHRPDCPVSEERISRKLVLKVRI